MNKIPTLFVRDPANRKYVTDAVTPGCEWVLAGEGKATRKFDGTCTMFDGANWWFRREVKDNTPAGFMPVETDPITNKTFGWEPSAQSGFYKYLLEALENTAFNVPSAGTYELVGPKINGNPERLSKHFLMRHGDESLVAPTDSASIKGLVKAMGADGIEGIVWWHPDGRKAKLKAKDIR